jgi:hypothetical protein
MFRATVPPSGVYIGKAMVRGKIACFCEISVSITLLLQSKVVPYTCQYTQNKRKE